MKFYRILIPRNNFLKLCLYFSVAIIVYQEFLVFYVYRFVYWNHYFIKQHFITQQQRASLDKYYKKIILPLIFILEIIVSLL